MTRFLLSLAGMALMWTGSEVTARYTPRSVYDKELAAQKKAFMVRGGRSLRSVERLGKYETADEAIRAAEKFRADGLDHVAVVHGTEGPDMWGENWAESFVVYRKQGKVYTEYGKTNSLTMAQGMAERIKLSGNEFEIVYYFPPK